MPSPRRAPQPAPSCALSEQPCVDGLALADGPARETLRLALQRLDQARATAGQPAALCQALTDAARALAALHAYSLAESCLAQAQRWALVMGATDLRADLACAQAEVASNAADLARAQGGASAAEHQARAQAREQAFEAARLAGQTADPHWEIRLLLRASDVLDRCGDHGDAVQMQERALVLMGLHDTELPTDTPPPAEPARDALRLAAPGRLM